MIHRFLNKTTLMFVLAILSGTALLLISQHVQKTQNALAALDYQKQKTQENLHILEAEWQYLNAPQRLEYLAVQYLGVDSPDFSPQLPDTLSPVFTGASALPSPLPPEKSDPAGSLSSPLFQNISLNDEPLEQQEGE